MPKWIKITLSVIGGIVLIVCFLSNSTVQLPTWIMQSAEMNLELVDTDEFGSSLVFQNAEQSSMCHLDYTTLVGSQSSLSISQNEMFQCTENGFYLVGDSNHNDFYSGTQKPSLKGCNLTVSRWSKEGTFQWELVFDQFSRFQNLQKTFLDINHTCTDTNENIYVTGVTNNRFFFNHWVPYRKHRFVLCLSKKQKLQWIHFYSTKYTTECFQIRNEKLYLVSSDSSGISTRVVTRIFSTKTGVKIKQRSFTTSYGFKLIHANEQGMYLLYRWPYDHESYDLKCVSWEGKSQWTCTIPGLKKPDTDIPYSWDRIAHVLCSSSDGIVVIGLTHAYFQSETIRPALQAYSMHAINKTGELIWSHDNSSKENASIVGLECLENRVTVLFQTNSTGVATKNAFQRELQGESDLFLSVYDLHGKQLWGTYIGGSGMEPYNVSSSKYRVACYLFLQDNSIVVACSTSSKDFPQVNACPVQFNPYQDKWGDFIYPPSYTALCVFNLEGQVQWSTYVTTDNTEEFQPSDVNLPYLIHQYDYIGNRLLGMKVCGNSIYIFEDTNNPNILLRNSKQNSLTVVDKFNLYNLVSRFTISD